MIRFQLYTSGGEDLLSWPINNKAGKKQPKAFRRENNCKKLERIEFNKKSTLEYSETGMVRKKRKKTESRAKFEKWLTPSIWRHRIQPSKTSIPVHLDFLRGVVLFEFPFNSRVIVGTRLDDNLLLVGTDCQTVFARAVLNKFRLRETFQNLDLREVFINFEIYTPPGRTPSTGYPLPRGKGTGWHRCQRNPSRPRPFWSRPICCTARTGNEIEINFEIRLSIGNWGRQFQSGCAG